MKIIVAILLVAIGFWAGHAFSSYYMEGEVMPALQRSQALHSASLMVQGVDLIDSGKVAALRGKLLAAAESQIDPLPDFPTNWRAVLAPPFTDSGDSIESLGLNNEAQATKLRERIRSLARLKEPKPGGSGEVGSVKEGS